MTGRDQLLGSVGDIAFNKSGDLLAYTVDASVKDANGLFVLDLRNGQIVSADGGSWPLTEVTGLLESGQILGKGARGPNPAGMQVLTFGVQVAEVAVDVETGEVRVDKIAAIHDVGRVINALGAESQVEGGIIQGIGGFAGA